MTTLREAATAALEALDSLWQRGVWGDFHGVADNLRAALAEPVQEPVAWQAVGGSIWAHKTREDDRPLYTAPPQRKPLTEEEIQELSQQHKFDSRMEKFVRIIEQAHGIKDD